MKKTSMILAQVNKEKISIFHDDKGYWIAIKPIFRLFNLSYKACIKSCISDKKLSNNLKKITCINSKAGKGYMLCVSEKYIIGFVFMISNNDSDLPTCILLLKTLKNCLSESSYMKNVKGLFTQFITALERYNLLSLAHKLSYHAKADKDVEINHNLAEEINDLKIS